MRVGDVRVRELERADPPAVFAAVSERQDVCFLDSALPEYTDSRWSYIAVDPLVQLEVWTEGARIRRRGESRWEPVEDWRQVVREFLPSSPPELPGYAPPFACGWAGWLGYELGREFDHIATHAATLPNAPLASLAFYDTVEAFDTRRQCRVQASCAELRPEPLDAADATVSEEPAPSEATAVACSLPKREYAAAVLRAKDYIAAGDIYQVNLTRQFRLPSAPEPARVYSRLRSGSPAPYAAFLAGPSGTLVSSSPELFLHYEPRTRRIVSRPIKGTRPRGATPEQDAALAEDLSSSHKDRAENVMIVDLVRNDLGRICSTGSVQTTAICRIETHPRVHHLVSTVEGTLAGDKDILDALHAAFPGGSVTGAPRIRACQIIRELEPTPRGPYTGALGFISISGEAKLAMSIRVVWLGQEGTYFSAGGAIVADSDVEQEYQETQVKAAAMRRAVGAADEP